MSSHLIRGRQLSRDTEHRIALRRNLVQSLFEHGEIRTTLPKAKEVKGLAEKLITEAKKGTVLARRRVIQKINDRRLVDDNQDFITEGSKTVVQKLFSEVAPKFKGRNGGYTRIIKTADWRIGDGGAIVILQLVGEETAPKATSRKSAGIRKKKTEKRKAFAAAKLTAKSA
jgi:large subunit ribosomal protein L17